MKNRFDLVALVLTLAIGRAAGAQDSTYRPLSVPHGVPLHCRALDSAGTTTVHMEVGEVPGAPVREIDARYDSLGRALTVTDWGSDAEGNDGHFEAALVWFVGAHTVGLFRRDSVASLRRDKERVLSGGDPAASFPPLTAIEERQARTFAAWLWTHRCHVHRGVR